MFNLQKTLLSLLALAATLLIVLSLQLSFVSEQKQPIIRYTPAGMYEQHNKKPQKNPATFRLTINGEITCSGTAVARQVILTASHCLNGEARNNKEMSGENLEITSLAINGVDIGFVDRVDDGKDHVLVRVTTKFNHFAVASPYDLEENDNIHYWGNPTFFNMYRRGYVAGFEEGQILLDVNGYQGDSGAGVFNDSGKLVGVISVRWSIGRYTDAFHVMGLLPMSFTVEQLHKIGVPATANNVKFYTKPNKMAAGTPVSEPEEEEDYDTLPPDLKELFGL